MCEGILVNVVSTTPVVVMARERASEAGPGSAFWLDVIEDALWVEAVRVFEAMAAPDNGEMQELHEARARRQELAVRWPELAPFDAGPYCMAALFEKLGDRWHTEWDRVVKARLYAAPTVSAHEARERLHEEAADE